MIFKKTIAYGSLQHGIKEKFFTLPVYALGCIHIKGLFLRAYFCLRERTFACVFPFRLICPLDSTH